MFIHVLKIVLLVLLSLFLISLVLSIIYALYLKIKGGYNEAKSEIKYRIKHQGRFFATIFTLIDVFDKALPYLLLAVFLYVLIHGK